MLERKVPRLQHHFQWEPRQRQSRPSNLKGTFAAVKACSYPRNIKGHHDGRWCFSTSGNPDVFPPEIVVLSSPTPVSTQVVNKWSGIPDLTIFAASLHGSRTEYLHPNRQEDSHTRRSKIGNSPCRIAIMIHLTDFRSTSGWSYSCCSVQLGFCVPRLSASLPGFRLYAFHQRGRIFRSMLISPDTLRGKYPHSE